MSYDEKVGAMASHPSNLDAAVERLVNSAAAELQGPSVDPVVCESTSLDVGIANDHPGGGELLDAVFFGDEGTVACVSATSRPPSARWGELLYDLSNSALAPWGARCGGAQVRLIGMLRLSANEGHVFVIAHSEMHVFKFPFDAWPSGIHMGAWDAICTYLSDPQAGRLEHRYSLSGWV